MCICVFKKKKEKMENFYHRTIVFAHVHISIDNNINNNHFSCRKFGTIIKSLHNTSTQLRLYGKQFDFHETLMQRNRLLKVPQNCNEIKHCVCRGKGFAFDCRKKSEIHCHCSPGIFTHSINFENKSFGKSW